MSAVLTPTAPAPKWAGGARPVRWTVAKFHKAREAGQLEGERTFLLHGVLMEQGPMNPPHAVSVELVMNVLFRLFGSGWRVRCQLPLVLNLYTDPFPDVAVVPGNVRDAALKHPHTASLVVEVSDSTLDIDTTDKAALYAMAGIPDYWVLDVTGRRLIVYREPDVTGERFASVRTLDETETISPLLAPGQSVRVSELLP